MRAGTLHTAIPAGQYGAARVVHDSPTDIDRMRGLVHGQPLTAQTYTRLLIDDILWMTDAEFECRTNYDVAYRSYGDILIAGLGLGLILGPVLQREEVRSVTVLERSSDVIALIGPCYSSPKLTIIKADVHLWQSPKKAFDFIYFDIWADIPNNDTRAEITMLKRRYRSALKKGGRTAAWCEEMARR
jgi:hypothetical protein